MIIEYIKYLMGIDQVQKIVSLGFVSHFLFCCSGCFLQAFKIALFFDKRACSSPRLLYSSFHLSLPSAPISAPFRFPTASPLVFRVRSSRPPWFFDHSRRGKITETSALCFEFNSSLSLALRSCSDGGPVSTNSSSCKCFLVVVSAGGACCCLCFRVVLQLEGRCCQPSTLLKVKLPNCWFDSLNPSRLFID